MVEIDTPELASLLPDTQAPAQADAAPRLRHVVAGNGPARRIGQSIAWLRSHYDGPLRVEGWPELHT